MRIAARLSVGFLVIAIGAAADPVAGRASGQGTLSGVIPAEAAARAGMVRSWAVQIGASGGRDHLVGVVCDESIVAAYTKRGLLQVIDAERGNTLWLRQVGHGDQISYAPAIGAKHVAVVHGREVFLLDREDGRELWKQSIEGVPSAAPALGPARLFVPTLRGRLVALALDDPERDPWFLAGSGMIIVPPLVTEKLVVWGTMSGTAFASQQDKVNVVFQLNAKKGIGAPLAARSPLIFIASRDQFLYAIHDETGTERWRFACGSAISEGPLVVGDDVFAVPEAGGMYCLNALTGDSRWFEPRVARVLSVSPNRVYAADKLGRTLLLDRSNGAMVGRLETSQLEVPITNSVTDRLVLGSRGGLVQCLRETDAGAPTRHRPKPAEELADEAAPATAPEATAPTPAADDATADPE